MKKGFTLAEVLITLAVIGVVAVLTVPNMMKSYQKQVSVTQLQKFYNQLRTAATNCMQEEMSDSLENTSFVNNPQSFVKKYLKATSFFTDSYDGFAKEYTALDGEDYGTDEMLDDFCAQDICASLETGSSIAVRTDADSGSVIIDVNGVKGPNITGRDLFFIRVNKDGTVGDFYDGAIDLKATCSAGHIYGGPCFDYIKNNGWVMDY